ncbi:MAG: T9SS type A sorting domain-containing protein [Lewinella sp.]|jgi:hypothetical protein|nr:T9SS type A sorting domain-containing protein [Lewinella sp.]
MKTSFFALFMAMCTCCFAQQNVLSVEPANVAKDVVLDNLDKDYQDITTVTVTNNGSRTLQLIKKQVVIGKPRAWRYGTFSRRNQNSPYVISQANQDTGRPVTLKPSESASFQVVLEPAGIVGDGRVEVQFFEISSPGKMLGKATVTAEIIQRSGSGPANPTQSGSGNFSSRPVPTSVNLFPNPARERFFVEAPPGTNIGRVEVSNALGNRLRKYDRPDGKQGYDVENLPDGLYLISIYDDKGKKLKTLRLLHRQFGA